MLDRWCEVVAKLVAETGNLFQNVITLLKLFIEATLLKSVHFTTIQYRFYVFTKKLRSQTSTDFWKRFEHAPNQETAAFACLPLEPVKVAAGKKWVLRRVIEGHRCLNASVYAWWVSTYGAELYPEAEEALSRWPLPTFPLDTLLRCKSRQ